MRDLGELLDVTELVVERARQVVPDPMVAEAKAKLRELRRKGGFVGDVFVLAIAGSTGAGKSSLLNAIAGDKVASVSHLRPHTDRPLIWLPEVGRTTLDRLAEELRIDDRVRHDRFDRLAIIDLPDMDSVADWHRAINEELLPRVDGVLWVFDPEKYADPIVHEHFLVPLSQFSDQMIFVLNKVDLIDEAGETAIIDELLRRLVADGHETPVFFPVAASPQSGQPEGIDDLASHLQHRMDTKRIATGKLLSDVDLLLRGIGEESATWDGSAMGFDEKWAENRDAAAEGLLTGAGPGGREDALCRIEDLLAMIAMDSGDTIGRDIREQFDPTMIEAVVDRAESAALQSGGGRNGVVAVAADTLEEDIGAPLRAMLVQRALMAATLTGAGVGVAEMRHQLMVGDTS